MCVIIHRQANIEFPYDKLKNAVLRNKDGFGLITHLGQGELDVRREYNPKGNDPEFIQSLMEDVKDLPISLHLRFATAGTKDESNCHPFKLIDKETYGRDIYFFHNGTISQFSLGSKGRSDTHIFAETLAKPVFQIAVNAYGEDWYKSSSLQEFLKYYAGMGSVFSFVDNETGHMIINKDLGYEQPGWWASNNSYFDPPFVYRPVTTTHGGGSQSGANPTMERRIPTLTAVPSSQTSYGTRTTGVPSNVPTASPVKQLGASCALPWKKDADLVSEELTPSTYEDAPAEEEDYYEDDSSLTIREEANKLRSFLKIYENNEVPNEAFVMFKSLASEKFRDLAGIYSLRDLTALDPDDIDEMIERYPKMTTLLIMDLLSELYFKEDNTSAATTPAKVSHVG